MARHFHSLVATRGERHACLSFRKVANWYCRVLRPDREIQQRLVQLESPAEFDTLLARMREQAVSSGEFPEPEQVISVPQGPVEFW
jgi:hypothetical protein